MVTTLWSDKGEELGSWAADGASLGDVVGATRLPSTLDPVAGFARFRFDSSAAWDTGKCGSGKMAVAQRLQRVRQREAKATSHNDDDDSNNNKQQQQQQQQKQQQ